MPQSQSKAPSAAKSATPQIEGYTLKRYYTKEGIHPYDAIEWETRTASIGGSGGKAVFEQEGVEIPKFWTQLATNVVVSKYFRGKLGSPERETSVKQLISRVSDNITKWGKQGGYFNDKEAEVFNAELTHILVNQIAAFNSPVWFNVGVREKPQCSACFILSIDDNMEAILDWIKKEGMIFKHGSGSGINLSPLRSSKEKLSLGGTASGPVSFMRGADASAGAIKSGGTTRRAAKMVVLNIEHPDIVEFIRSKELEEKKAWALGEMGYDMGLNGEAWNSIQFQNANNSVRVTKEFLKAVEDDAEFSTKEVSTGNVAETFKARDLMKMISDAAWVCGDPGIQYDTTINEWHTCPNTGRINASNPCSEYMHIDNSACNLSSLNLMKFVDKEGNFNVEAFQHAASIMTLAQEIIVGFSSYPTPEITRNSIDYRQLGLGYANLGALLMSWGLPYDSDEGRAIAGAITALMTGTGYKTSAEIAAKVGPFAGYMKNREPMLGVMLKHRAALKDIDTTVVPSSLMEASKQVWDEVVELGEKYGFRNAQATVLAPTGTISFMMDCDTTGVEPDIALVKYKTLVGGGMMKIVNRTVPLGLKKLGYSEEQVKKIVEYVDEHDTIEGAPELKDEHLPVFDCAFKPTNGERSIGYMGHLKMMAAAQPFISGAISKTVNLPENITSEEIGKIYVEGGKMGLKAIAIYRDGSKRTQPLNTLKKEKKAEAKLEIQEEKIESTTTVSNNKPYRRHLSDTRRAVTHKFAVAGHEGYITVGLYEDGMPGELFLTMSKEGSTLSGLMDAFATMVSVSLQYGVPLKDLVKKFSHMRFEPSGFTRNEDIPIAKSIIDYLFRWLGMQFLNVGDRSELGLADPSDDMNASAPAPAVAPVEERKAIEETKAQPVQEVKSEVTYTSETFTVQVQEDAPTCADCGSLMVRNGACYKCWNCGSTSGCS